MVFLIALLVAAAAIYLLMIGIILLAGVIEGRLPPKLQKRPYPEAHPGENQG
jgi:hypothetical protein